MTYAKNILIIDNDLNTCKSLKYGLLGKGYSVYYVCSEKEGFKHLFHQNYHLIIMETVFEKTNEWEFLSVIRKICDIPIFIISLKRELCDIVKGLNLGADDYLIKPFELDEVFARVNALLRRCGKLSEADNKAEYIIKSSHIELDMVHRVVLICGEEVFLTKTEFELLHFLMIHKEQVVAKDQICYKLWEKSAFESSNRLMCQIRGLRKKIESVSNHSCFIKNIWGVGYLFQDK